MKMAFRVLALAFQSTWQEFWTILVLQLLCLVSIVLILPGPPAILALFYYGNRVANAEPADERDFLKAFRKLWGPGWRWAMLNLLVVGFLTGDYVLIGNLIGNPTAAAYLQGFYLALLLTWLLLQLFTLPFLFEQSEPRVLQALRNASLFLRRNLIFGCLLGSLLLLSLTGGTLLFMISFAWGGAFVAFAGNHAVLMDLADE